MSNNAAGKEKSLDFLTHALAEVGFSPAHARRACLATNLAGVPQAIEWALAHLDEETNPNSKETPRRGANAGRGIENTNSTQYPPSSPGTDGSGLVVELPDGKLFKLSNPNGRVVEMPNGSVVEMLDGQVVEMSNGQQLEMVDGSLVEIRPATIQLDEGEIVGHRIVENKPSAAPSAGPPRHNNVHSQLPSSTSPAGGASPSALTLAPSRPPVPDKEGLSDAEKRQLQAQEERLRRHHMQVLTREEQLHQAAAQLTEREKGVSGKQQQLTQHQNSLRDQEEQLARQRAAIQAERESLRKQAETLKKREQEQQEKERAVQRKEQELSRLQAQLRHQDKELKDRESALAVAAANGASASSTVSAGGGGGTADEDALGKEVSAMDNIEAVRIRFNELTLGSLLGSGSFADVYRAEWRMPCAVKKMKGRISKEQMTEFVREGEMMRSLKHPGIVKLLGVCVESGSFYLVQEMVNGFGNLFDYLHKKKARLTYWQCIQISCGICEAMTYLHEKHIVHRDLKPQNCLLVNEKGEVKLCDFGLARLKNTAFVETVSNTAGTPAYQAPEMLRDEPISEKVDLYGFGIMLWEMYTGKLPWHDKNYHQMIHTVAVRNERPPITPDIPRELVAIIEVCWHPSPSKRPIFSDLRTQFREIAKNLPTDVPKTQPPPQPAQQHSVSRQHQQAMAQPAHYAYMQQQQQQQQQQQPMARQPHAVAPQYQAPPPVVYGGYQQAGW